MHELQTNDIQSNGDFLDVFLWGISNRFDEAGIFFAENTDHVLWQGELLKEFPLAGGMRLNDPRRRKCL